MITSITYRVVTDAAGMQMVPLGVKLRDPWPTNPSFLTLTWPEVQQRFLGLVYFRVVPLQ